MVDKQIQDILFDMRPHKQWSTKINQYFMQSMRFLVSFTSKVHCDNIVHVSIYSNIVVMCYIEICL